MLYFLYLSIRHQQPFPPCPWKYRMGLLGGMAMVSPALTANTFAPVRMRTSMPGAQFPLKDTANAPQRARLSSLKRYGLGIERKRLPAFRAMGLTCAGGDQFGGHNSAKSTVRARYRNLFRHDSLLESNLSPARFRLKIPKSVTTTQKCQNHTDQNGNQLPGDFMKNCIFSFHAYCANALLSAAFAREISDSAVQSRIPE